MSHKRANAYSARIAAPVAACLLALTGWAGSALGGPVNPQVQAGSVTITPTFGPNGTVSWQIISADGSIVNFDSFDILSNESVYFSLPSSSGRILNRIVSDFDGTQIDGALGSNGIVYFVNPAGIFFGNGAVVDVGGIYAAAGTITDGDFLAEGGLGGTDRFTLTGDVVNAGTINTAGGIAALLGRSVANYGTIDVGSGGVLALVSGQGAVLTPRDPNGHIMVAVDSGGGTPADDVAGVYNAGNLNAPGGQIVLGSGDLYALAIRNDGVIGAAGGLVQMNTLQGDIGVGGTIAAAGGNVEMTAGLGGRVDIDATFGADKLTLDAGGAGLDLLLTSDLLIDSPGDDLTFGLINTDGEPWSLTINAASALFGDQVGNLNPDSLPGTLAVNGFSEIDTNVMNVLFSLLFNGNVQVDRDSTLTAGFDAIFNGTLDSQAFALAGLNINASRNTEFHGRVGGDLTGNTLFRQITTDSFGTTIIDTDSLIVQLNLTFGDDVVLAQDTTLVAPLTALFNGRLDSTFVDNGDVGGVAPSGHDVRIVSNSIRFNNQVGARTDTITMGETEYNLTRPGTLTTTLSTVDVPGLVAGTTTINTDLVQADTFVFNQDVIIDRSTTVDADSEAWFNGAVDSRLDEYNDLTVNAPWTLFEGDVGASATTEGGGVSYLGLLHTTNDGPGDVTLFGVDDLFNPFLRDQVVNAAQMVFDDDIILDSISPGVTLTLNAITRNDFPEASGGVVNGSVLFNARVDSQTGLFNNLVVNSYDTRFNGQVGNRGLGDRDGSAAGGPIGGSLTALGTLQTDADGLTIVDTDVVNGTDLDFNDDVLLESSTTLTGTGSVDFAGRVDSQSFELNDLTINSPDTAFHGRVGDSTAFSQLGTLTTDAAGTTTIDTDKVVALFALDVNDDVVLAQDTWLTGGFSADFYGRIDSEGKEGNSLLVTSQNTRFGGQIGNAGSETRLGALETDLSGTTTIDTDVINADTVTFNDAVLLASDTTIDADHTTFNRTLDDDVAWDEDENEIRHTMTITGDALLNGEVGGESKLGGLIVQGGTEIYGGLVNADYQEYVGAVQLPTDKSGSIGTLISGDDQLIFRSTIDGSGELMVVGAGDALFEGDITLGSFETALEGTLIFDHVSINADGDVVFNNAVTLLDVPTVATIGSNGDLNIHAASFRMGQNQKLSVLGNLTIDVAGGTATLGDIGALGFIDVTADTIDLLLRAASQVETPDGTLITDFGLDIVAGGSIDFSVVPDSVNRDTRPRVHFSTPNGDGDITGNLQDFIMHAGGDVTMDDIIAEGGYFLDLYAKGPTTADIAEAAAANAKIIGQLVVPEPVPGPGIQQRLRSELDIPVRMLDRAELVTLLGGRMIYFDTPNSSVDRSRQTSQVTVNRLLLSRIFGALQTYDLILESQTPEGVRDMLAQAWNGYVESAGADADPAGLDDYLLAQGDQAAVDMLRLIKQLRHELETMGMAPEEELSPVANLARTFMPADISPQVFNRILSGVN